MSDQITISFVATKKLKHLIERWAREDDRSVSYILRQILVKEAQRRATETRQSQNPDQAE